MHAIQHSRWGNVQRFDGGLFDYRVGPSWDAPQQGMELTRIREVTLKGSMLQIERQIGLGRPKMVIDLDKFHQEDPPSDIQERGVLFLVKGDERICLFLPNEPRG